MAAFDAFRPSESGHFPEVVSGDGGFIVDPEWLPTETTRPMESLDDGGIIIIGGFPTETIRPMESLDDGGFIVDWFTTESIHPTPSGDSGFVIDWFV